MLWDPWIRGREGRKMIKNYGPNEDALEAQLAQIERVTPEQIDALKARRAAVEPEELSAARATAMKVGARNQRSVVSAGIGAVATGAGWGCGSGCERGYERCCDCACS